MAKNIFWYQPAKLSEADVIILNDNKLVDNIERSKAFALQKSLAEKVVGKKRHWYGKVDGYFFVKGMLDETDERGRKLSFVFVSDEIDAKSALYRALNIAGKSVDETTAACLNKEPSVAYKNKIFIAGIIALCVIIAILIAANCNRQ